MSDENKDKIKNVFQELEAEKASKGVKCRAEPKDEKGKVIKKMTDQELFRKLDDFYSVQGETGLCCRHALAKALLASWKYSFTATGHGHLKHPMDLRSMIAFLITSVQKGSKGARVLDFQNYKGTFADETL